MNARPPPPPNWFDAELNAENKTPPKMPRDPVKRTKSPDFDTFLTIPEPRMRANIKTSPLSTSMERIIK